MAKRTINSAFRNLKVNAYSDDEDDEDLLVEETGPNETEVQSLLNQNRNIDALKLVLNTAPINTKNQAIKDKAVLTVMRVMLSFKTAEIENAIKSLNTASLDLLMKYIFRGFEFPTDNSSIQLLTWHEKVFAVGGLGTIVRVLTERKRV